MTLDASNKNRYGDPMPKIEHRMDEATAAREAATKEHVLGVFKTLAKASNGRIVNTSVGDYLDHPGGGCRMGTDPGRSVLNEHCQSHEVKNLFVVDGSSFPSYPEKNPTETVIAVSLRAADYLAEQLRKGNL